MSIAPTRRTTSPATRRRRHGFTLLEVVLALAILLGAIAVMGELVRLGTINAAAARDLTQAQLLCQSVMAEITAEITPADPVQAVPFEIDPEWVYSVELESVDEPGMMQLRVTVAQNFPPAQRPIKFSLVRWIADPGIELSDESSGTTSSQDSSSSTSANE